MSKFKIPVIPPSTPCSVRFPNDLIEEVESTIKGKGTTFSAFVVAATRYALNDLKNTEDNNPTNIKVTKDDDNNFILE